MEQNVLKDVIINKDTEVLHSFVDLRRVLPASRSDMSQILAGWKGVDGYKG
jgi:hypothetical protein